MSATFKATLQLLIGAMAIGLAPVFVKLLTEGSGVGPVGAGFWRMAIGSLGFLALRSRVPTSRVTVASRVFDGRAVTLTAVAGLLFAMDLAAWHTSFKYTTVASSTLIANLSSVLVPLCGVVLFGEPFKKGLLGGGLLAISGVAGLTMNRHASSASLESQSLVLGEGLAFLTAFFYTGYMLSIKSLTKSVPPGVAMLWSSFVSAVVLLIFCVLLGEEMFPRDYAGWAWLFGVGLVSQLAGQGLIANALSVLPVSRSALMLLFAPTSSAVFGWLFLGERLNAAQTLSVVVTLAGIAIVALSAKRGQP